MEADFARFYALDLGEVVLKSPRKALALVRNLPPNSAIAIEANGGVVWTEDTELLAVQAEMLFAMIRVMMQGFGAKRSQVPKQITIDRPWDRAQQRQPKRKATVRETVDILGSMMRGPHG